MKISKSQLELIHKITSAKLTSFEIAEVMAKAQRIKQKKNLKSSKYTK